MGQDSQAVIARFKAERQTLAMLDHPHIAKVFDAGVSQRGRPFFVMELVRGERITDFCDRRQFSLRQRLAVVIQVCRALEHAHQKGVIHRDIKPSNLLVTETDQIAAPKLIDFGVAKATTRPRVAGQSIYTALDQVVGTPAYMSPEQAGVTPHDVDTRSDIYSLGALLYELLTGTPPFDPERLRRAAPDEACRILRDEEPPRPSARLAALPPDARAEAARRRSVPAHKLVGQVQGDLDWLVMRALDKDPARRYATASDLAADLARHLAHEPITAGPPTALYRWRKFTRRNRLAVIASALLLTTLLAGLAVSLTFYFRATAAEQATRKEARHSREFEQLLQRMLDAVRPGVAAGRDTKLLREMLDQASRRLDEGAPLDPDIERDLRSTLGSVFADLGDYALAEQAYRRAIALQRQAAADPEGNLAAQLSGLASALEPQGKWAEAEAVSRESLALNRAQYPPGHPRIGASLNRLGVALWRQEHFAEAETALREALAIEQAQPRPAPSDLAADLGNLGNLCGQQGKYAEAETYFRQALALQRQSLGTNHPIYARTLGQLGGALDDQGKRAEGEPLLREALALRRRILPPDHPELAFSLHNLAQAIDTTQPAEAIRLYRECVSIRQRRLPPGHPYLLGSLKSLVTLLQQQNQAEEAAALLGDLAAYWRERQAREPALAIVPGLNFVGLLYQDLGKLPEAEALLREALDLLRRQPGTSVPELATLRTNLQRVLKAQGKPTE